MPRAIAWVAVFVLCSPSPSFPSITQVAPTTTTTDFGSASGTAVMISTSYIGTMAALCIVDKPAHPCRATTIHCLRVRRLQQVHWRCRTAPRVHNISRLGIQSMFSTRPDQSAVLDHGLGGRLVRKDGGLSTR
ncbi:hypothetical protein IW261DRAFT_1513028 [Armillaria novae-zelandiae]|uniref:Secreted protein n=1 Tax=Armillaria novae-zelandiae TaxID=153914 RepID=A0AA39NSW5_9AGAR|nr:hypothetical protein IW261DRAFT_1513028 [Armillaria novae-zelandiae]